MPNLVPNLVPSPTPAAKSLHRPRKCLSQLVLRIEHRASCKAAPPFSQTKRAESPRWPTSNASSYRQQGQPAQSASLPKSKTPNKAGRTATNKPYCALKSKQFISPKRRNGAFLVKKADIGKGSPGKRHQMITLSACIEIVLGAWRAMAGR